MWCIKLSCLYLWAGTYKIDFEGIRQLEVHLNEVQLKDAKKDP